MQLLLHKEKYTVTYQYNSGSGTPASAVATYTFNGYYTATSDGTQYLASTGFLTASASTTNFSANGSLYAQWTSGSVTLPTPTRTGYTFGGWYSNSGLTTSVGMGGVSYTPTAGVTLYAKWTANTYQVKFNTNGGSGTMANQTFTYDAAAKALTANAFNRTGATFAGWATGATTGVVYSNGQSVSNLTIIHEDIVNLYARWSVTITVAKNRQPLVVTVSVTGGSTQLIGDSVGINATPSSGHTFTSWAVTSGSATIANNSVASTTISAFTGNVTVTATFTGKPATIVMVASPNWKKALQVILEQQRWVTNNNKCKCWHWLEI